MDPKELAEELAADLTDITNSAKPLELHEIPKSKIEDVLIPQLFEENVSKRIKKYKKPNSSVQGDIRNH